MGSGAYKISGGQNEGGDYDSVAALSLSLSTLGATADGYANNVVPDDFALQEQCN